jgi:hypothetical protein
MLGPRRLCRRGLFSRAPAILPGMPSGRPCALAKTSARTRKHRESPLTISDRHGPITCILKPLSGRAHPVAPPSDWILFTKLLPCTPSFRAPSCSPYLLNPLLALHPHSLPTSARRITSSPSPHLPPAPPICLFPKIISPLYSQHFVPLVDPPHSSSLLSRRPSPTCMHVAPHSSRSVVPFHRATTCEPFASRRSRQTLYRSRLNNGHVIAPFVIDLA